MESNSRDAPPGRPWYPDRVKRLFSRVDELLNRLGRVNRVDLVDRVEWTGQGAAGGQFVSPPPELPNPRNSSTGTLDPEKFPLPPPLPENPLGMFEAVYDDLFGRLEAGELLGKLTAFLGNSFPDWAGRGRGFLSRAVAATYLALCTAPTFAPGGSLEGLVEHASGRYGVERGELELGLKTIVGYRLLPGLESLEHLSAFLGGQWPAGRKFDGQGP
ncbi:MAG: hypothetical protein ACTSU5_01455 [Promethearchaeota archaeon]